MLEEELIGEHWSKSIIRYLKVEKTDVYAYAVTMHNLSSTGEIAVRTSSNQTKKYVEFILSSMKGRPDYRFEKKAEKPEDFLRWITV